MGELSLFPAVRNAAADTLIVADGTPAGIRSRTARGARLSTSRASWR